jgi:hypothetical protein
MCSYTFRTPFKPTLLKRIFLNSKKAMIGTINYILWYEFTKFKAFAVVMSNPIREIQEIRNTSSTSKEHLFYQSTRNELK